MTLAESQLTGQVLLLHIQQSSLTERSQSTGSVILNDRQCHLLLSLSDTDEPTVISARLYHHHLCRSLHLVEVGAVFVKKKKKVSTITINRSPVCRVVVNKS